MGFSDYARVLVRNNRNLQKSMGGKFVYPKKYNKSNTSKPTNKLIDVTAEESERKKKRVVIGSTLIILVVSLLLIPRIINKVDGLMTSTDYPYDASIQKNINLEKQKAYDYWVKIGNQHFDGGYYSAAYDEYLFAKGIFNEGKRANYGLTLCLIKDCRTKNINCDLAKQYQERLMLDGHLTDAEIVSLYTIK